MNAPQETYQILMGILDEKCGKYTPKDLLSAATDVARLVEQLNEECEELEGYLPDPEQPSLDLSQEDVDELEELRKELDDCPAYLTRPEFLRRLRDELMQLRELRELEAVRE